MLANTANSSSSEDTVMKSRMPKLWFVVADAGRAAAYVRRGDGNGYDEVTSWSSELVLPKDERPQFTDRPTRVFDSLGGQRHAAETTSPQELAKQEFGRSLARALNKARGRREFEALVLFAAPRLLHDLREHFDRATGNAVAYSEAKDLTKLPGKELFATFDAVALEAAGWKTPRARGGAQQ
jgi:protein required for attachment to host cells